MDKAAAGARRGDEGGDEKALLARVKRGDADALEALLARYQAPLFRFSMRMCRDREDAREVLQESLLAAARSMGDFRGEAALSTWLFTIARRFCIKQRRKAQAGELLGEPAHDGHGERAEHGAPGGQGERDGRDGRDDQVTQMEDPRPAPEEALADRELLTAIDGAIALLEPGYREVMLLRDVEGLTAPEVASALEMTVPQVKSRLHRARAAVRLHLAPLFAELHPAPALPRPGCPDIAETFSRFLEGEISPDLCARMQAHVDGCGDCASTCDALKHTLAVCHAVPAPAVPEDIQQAVRDEIRKLARA